jgi:hypothetical protein
MQVPAYNAQNLHIYIKGQKRLQSVEICTFIFSAGKTFRGQNTEIRDNARKNYVFTAGMK